MAWDTYGYFNIPMAARQRNQAGSFVHGSDHDAHVWSAVVNCVAGRKQRVWPFVAGHSWLPCDPPKQVAVSWLGDAIKLRVLTQLARNHGLAYLVDPQHLQRLCSLADGHSPCNFATDGHLWGVECGHCLVPEVSLTGLLHPDRWGQSLGQNIAQSFSDLCWKKPRCLEDTKIRSVKGSHLRDWHDHRQSPVRFKYLHGACLLARMTTTNWS